MPPQSSRPRDARIIAKLLIARYGVQATSYAALQALKARERGDQRITEAWRLIADTIAELLRSDPDDDEPVTE
jgi:hypothetical protein